MASSIMLTDELKSYSHRFLLPDTTELLSIPDEEDEDDLNESIESKTIEKEFISNQSQINFSRDKNKFLSRSYKFVQLERAFTLANLLTNKNDRIQFQHDYRESLRENKFDKFLEISYKKLDDHKEKLKQERILKRTRTFTFVNLEKNFLALDPTRDIKIVFLDDSITSSTPNLTNIHRNSTVSNRSNDDTIEAFYENRSHHLLQDPSRARDEITLFARRAGERLQQRLPQLACVPHRVKIIDERDIKNNFDQQTLLQIKHKHNLTLISKRRQLVMKMMNQTKKNQIKMSRLNFQSPLTMNNPSCCQELLERINQIEHIIQEEQLKQSQISFNSQKTISKTTNYSSIQTTSTITASMTTPSFSSCSTPFQDALSLHHAAKLNNNVHVIQPKRPFTAPIDKMAWVNYC